MAQFFRSSIVRRLNLIVLSVISLGMLVFSAGIGWHTYEQVTTGLGVKAAGIAKVASIALQEPIWNYDADATDGVVEAILLDRDVVGIEIVSAETGEALRQKFIDPIEGLTLEDMRQRRQTLGLLINEVPIEKDGNQIGQVSIITSNAAAREQIERTTMLIAGFAAAFVAIMGFLFWASAKKSVARPLKKLEMSANQLAAGQLDYEIDTSRHDEIGKLAKRFSAMRDAIRKKLADLNVLNATGEKLAGIHDQNQALEAVLRVMSEQNHLELGSIYLLEGDELVISAFYPPLTDDETPPPVPRRFRMGEGIAGQAAQEGRTLFIPDTSKAPEYVADGQNSEPRALLCVPMMDDQKVFGVMNFSGSVDKVAFLPEDENFALTLARMTVVTTKNIQMINVIEEQNRTLEQKVLERTAELRQKTNDINSMLQNMQQGICTITASGLIHPEFSAFLTRILDTEEIANRPFMEVLFGHAQLGADQANQVEVAIEAILGEDEMMYDFNAHLLINEYNLVTASGEKKILDADWAPIIGEDGQVEKLMVTIRDMTELRALQQEAERQRQELEIIGQILAVNQQKFSEFLSTSKTYLKENEQLIKQTEDKDISVLATLFRNMHTIKGNARTYGFKYLTDAIHEAEQTYDELRKREDVSWDKDRLQKELGKAEEYMEWYRDVYESKLGNFGDQTEGRFMEQALFDQLQQVITQAKGQDAAAATAALDRASQLLRATEYTAMSEVLDGILKALPTMAKDLGKEAPQVIIEDQGIRATKELTPVLKDVFMHMMRNALDHGLETAEERQSKGKPAAGTLRLTAQWTPEALTLDLHDDGRGLALARIRQKAEDAGLLNPQQSSDEAIAEFIFHSGLSTAQTVSDISGRGVGMDAVRRFLEQKGGQIELYFRSDADKGQAFRAFGLRVTLPGKHFIKV